MLQLEAIEATAQRLIGRFRSVVAIIGAIIGVLRSWRNAIEVTESRLTSYDFHTQPGNLTFEL
ncbi:hypothetical protein BG011_000520, partial [Mortierella polycephala]